MKKIVTLQFLLSLAFFAGATNYYVDGINGNNANGGTSLATAFRTLPAAAALTNAGDIVFVMNGTYTATGNVLTISRSGSAGAPIVYTAYPGHSPKLQASIGTYACIALSAGTSYITINGLELSGYGVNLSLAADTIPAKNQLTCPVAGSPATAQAPVQKYNGHGFTADSRSVTTGSHHIVISNNTVHDFGASGISFLNCDYITIESNTVYNNSWYTIYGTSGISFNESYNYDGNTATYRNIVRNNTSYNNRMYVPYYNDCKVTDGNGIILDIAKPTYAGKTLVANNICYNNGGSGIHSFRMNNVDIVHNVSYFNSASPEINGGGIHAREADNIKIYNNIIVARPGKKVNGNVGSTNLVYDYNVYFGGSSVDYVGTNSLIQDPKFLTASTDAATANFRLQAGSVAINNGDNNYSTPVDKDGVARPINTKVDIGGYESSLAGPFGVRGTPQTKTLGSGNGLGEGNSGYLYAPYDSRPANGNQKSRKAIIYPQALLTNNGIPANAILERLEFRRAVQTSTTNTTPSTQTVPDHSIIRIYLRNEASDNFGAAAFDWNSLLPGAANPAVLVYGGEAATLIGAAGGWKPVLFQVPFNYTGGNLGVYIEYLQKGSITGATDINWIYDNGGSQPLYNTGTNPNQVNATKSTATTGTISDNLSTSNERRPVMRVGYYTTTVMPVALQTFTAVKSGNVILLNWLTASETDNAGFDVQRSANGATFKTIGFVASKALDGTSTAPNSYGFTDAQALKGKTYYRLTQKDQAGRQTYSNIVAVNIAGDFNLSGIFPNPVRNTLQIAVYADKGVITTICVQDLKGRVIKRFTKPLVSGYNRIDLAVASLASSTYILQLTLPSGERLTEKFIKE